MAGIPEEIVDRIRAEANIVDVISDYLRLRRAGKNWIGLCPFHDDKKPSLNVEPIKGIYKCFACGKGGNAFTFLMDLNGWSFPEAARNLATQLGIEIPELDRDRRAMPESERLATVVAEAASYFREIYLSSRGEPARAYFRKRALGEEIVSRFQLGYTPDEWEGLLTAMTSRGFTPEELDRAGLVVRREGRTGYYDRFRGRTIFPIFSTTGRIVGFGARRMSEDPDQPKYINSPETPLYHKSRVLYGLFQAKDAIRRVGHALLVEGYVDVISLHQGGIEHAVATCGTALAREHADTLARYTNRVVLVFDSDKAGESATEKGIDILLKRGLDVSVLRLPDGEDPDTFVRTFGAKELERRIDSSISFLEFRARQLKNSGAFDAPERQAEAIRSVVATIALIPDPLKRELYYQRIASDYFLPEALLQRELERAVGEERRGEQRRALRTPVPAPSIEQSRVAADDVATALESSGSVFPPLVVSDLPAAEMALLRVLIQGDPQMLEHVLARIAPDDFGHPLTRALLHVVRGHFQEQGSFSLDAVMMEELDASLRDLATLLAIDRETISSYWSQIDPSLTDPNQWKAARDCLVHIEQGTIDREARAIQHRLLQGGVDEGEERSLLERFRELRSRSEALKTLISG